jgi:hypothetical protein
MQIEHTLPDAFVPMLFERHDYENQLSSAS